MDTTFAAPDSFAPQQHQNQNPESSSFYPSGGSDLPPPPPPDSNNPTYYYNPAYGPFSSSDGSRPPPPMALPPGMEVAIADHQTGQDTVYRIQYSCYRMKRSEADEYMYRLSEYVARYGRPV